MGGAEFLSLVEAVRAFGWAAIGIHFVHLYVIPGLFAMMLCHMVAFFLDGRARLACRGMALALSAVIGACFLVILWINPTLRNGLVLLCSMYMFIRTFLLFRHERDQSTP
jgi:hypothetical protein